MLGESLHGALRDFVDKGAQGLGLGRHAGDAFRSLLGDAGVIVADGLDVLRESLHGALCDFVDMGAQGVGLGRHVLHGGLCDAGELFRRARTVLRQRLGETVAGGVQDFLGAAGFLAQARRDFGAGVGERLLQGGAVDRDDLVQAVGLTGEVFGQLFAPLTDGLAEKSVDILEMLRQGLRMGADLFDEGGDEAAQLAVDLRGALVDGARRLGAGAFEALKQTLRVAFHSRQKRVVRSGESRLHLAALLLEGAKNAVAGFLEQAGQAAGRRFELARDGILRRGEGRGDAVGVDDDGFAFARQFSEQHAYAPLVFAIGALQRRHFAPHHGFEFGRARQGPLHAVAH